MFSSWFTHLAALHFTYVCHPHVPMTKSKPVVQLAFCIPLRYAPISILLNSAYLLHNLSFKCVCCLIPRHLLDLGLGRCTVHHIPLLRGCLQILLGCTEDRPCLDGGATVDNQYQRRFGSQGGAGRQI